MDNIFNLSTGYDEYTNPTFDFSYNDDSYTYDFSTGYDEYTNVDEFQYVPEQQTTNITEYPSVFNTTSATTDNNDNVINITQEDLQQWQDQYYSNNQPQTLGSQLTNYMVPQTMTNPFSQFNMPTLSSMMNKTPTQSLNAQNLYSSLQNLLKQQYDFNNEIAKRDIAIKEQYYSTLGNVIQQQVDIAKQQLGIQQDYLTLAKENWNYTKSELDRIAQLRQKLTQQYLS